MKTSKYVIIVLLFIALVISVTVSTLYIKYEIKGDFNYSKNYYEIKYSNIEMGNDDIVVKINEENNTIHIDIPELDRTATISVDITNIGSSNVILDSYQILNIDTSLNKDNVIITTSLNKDEVIKGGYSKKLIINVKNNNKGKGYYNFNIDATFKES